MPSLTQLRPLKRSWRFHRTLWMPAPCGRHTQHPARVWSAYWKSDVASSAFCANCFANVRDTNLLKKSPTTMPRTPPSGFCNAVIRPNRTTATMSEGICHLAKELANMVIAITSDSRSRRGLKCSAHMPEGPGAAPRLELRRLFTNSSPPNTTGDPIWQTARLLGSLGRFN